MDFAPVSSKEFLDIQATVEYGFTLGHVRDMIGTYSKEFQGLKITSEFYRSFKFCISSQKKWNGFLKAKPLTYFCYLSWLRLESLTVNNDYRQINFWFSEDYLTFRNSITYMLLSSCNMKNFQSWEDLQNSCKMETLMPYHKYGGIIFI